MRGEFHRVGPLVVPLNDPSGVSQQYNGGRIAVISLLWVASQNVCTLSDGGQRRVKEENGGVLRTLAYLSPKNTILGHSKGVGYCVTSLSNICSHLWMCTNGLHSANVKRSIWMIVWDHRSPLFLRIGVLFGFQIQTKRTTTQKQRLVAAARIMPKKETTNNRCDRKNNQHNCNRDDRYNRKRKQCQGE